MAHAGRPKKGAVNKMLWDRANGSDRNRWRSKAQQGYDFYLDEQLTKQETEYLEEAGMPSFTINRILPIIEIMKYFVTANNPRWKAVGATGDDVEVAQVHSEMADYSWYLSNGNSLYGQVITDSLTKSVGYFMVDIDQDMDNGKGEVVFRRIDPFDVFVDPASRDILFRDAAFIIIKKNLSRTQLKVLFPQYERKIAKVPTGITEGGNYSQRDVAKSSTTQPEDISSTFSKDGEDEDLIGYYERYSKVKIPYVNVFINVPPSKEEMAQIKESVKVMLKEFQAEVEVQTAERIAEIEKAFANEEIIEERAQLEVQKAISESKRAIEQKNLELTTQAKEQIEKIEQTVMTKEHFDIAMQSPEFSKTVVDYVEFNETRIELNVSVGDDCHLYEYQFPITEYPIVPIPYIYSGTVYPMSAVTPLVGKQREINKAHQIMIHNANLASNLRWLYEEGSVDEDQWEKYSSSPGALLKYRQGFQSPTPILPAQINNAFYTITQEGKGDAEYISGVPSAMMGFTQQQAETYRGLLANDEFGTRRLKAWMTSTVEPALEHLGRVYQQMAQKHYTIEKVFRIVQPEAGQSSSQSDEKEVRINIPIYNDYGEAIGRWMDYETAKFDVRIIAGATLPVNRWALLDEYFKWFESGLIDDIAMIAETDIRGKKALLQRKSLYSQMQSQLEQMQEALKDKEDTIESLSGQLVQAGIKAKIQQGDIEVRKDVLQTEAEQKLLRGMMRNEFETIKKEMKMEVKNAIKESKLNSKNNS